MYIDVYVNVFHFTTSSLHGCKQRRVHVCMYIYIYTHTQIHSNLKTVKPQMNRGVSWSFDRAPTRCHVIGDLINITIFIDIGPL